MSVRMKDCENERRNECEGVRVTPPMSVPSPNEKGGGAPFTERQQYVVSVPRNRSTARTAYRVS